MNAHTPGPWEVIELPHTGLIGIKRGDRVLNLEPDQEPDANLIAAAPDLLSALEALLADAPATGLMSVYLARDAIAKAKGEIK